MVATCPNAKCSKPIPDGHSYTWCTACGEKLPESIQLQLTKLQEDRTKAESARTALGSRPEIKEICTRCGTHFMTTPRLDFLGFREFTCPNCHLRAITPLRWPYRITYWAFLCLWVLGLVQSLSDRDESLRLGLAGAFLLLLYLLSAILKDLRIVYCRWRSG
jgi:DNA-directed RNA polymerase subunit RPC12/RpoP